MDDASDPQALGETAGDRIRREREARERNSFCNIAERAVLKKEAERKHFEAEAQIVSTSNKMAGLESAVRVNAQIEAAREVGMHVQVEFSCACA